MIKMQWAIDFAWYLYSQIKHDKACTYWYRANMDDMRFDWTDSMEVLE